MSKKNENNSTKNNSFTLAILANRGFSGAKIKENASGAGGWTITKDDMELYTSSMTMLHEKAYNIAVKRFNNVEVTSDDINAAFDALKYVYGLFELEGDKKLRVDNSALDIIIGFAGSMKNTKSYTLDYEYSKLKNAKRQYAVLEGSKGANPTAITRLINEIAEIENNIVELKKEAFNYYKSFTITSFKTFCKSVEDFLTDTIEKRLAMTAEEIKAEKERIKKARKNK